MTDSRLASSFVQAAKYRVNPGRPFRVIVIHDMEAPEGPATAENCARFFAGPSAGGSAHYCVDTDSIVQSVKEADQAAHAPGANTDGIGIELCGYARQSRDEWLDPASLATMRLAAGLVADISARTGIPYRWLTDEQLADRQTKGMVTHAQVSRVFRQSDHTDPGPDFPADEFLRLVDTKPTTSGGSPDMLDLITLNHSGVEFRCYLGVVNHRWQPTPGAKYGDFKALDGAGNPPSPVDSVKARAAWTASGECAEIEAWNTADPSKVWRTWQTAVGGKWSPWVVA